MTQGGPGPKAKRPTLEEPPRDEIQRLMEDGHTEAYLIIKLYNAKGLGSIPSRVFPLAGLLDDSLANMLEAEHGGGKFLIEPRTMEDHGRDLCSRFSVVVLGQSKYDMTSSYASPKPFTTPTSGDVAMGYRFGSATGTPPTIQPRELASYRSDEIAIQQTQDYRDENKRLRREMESREKAHATQLEMLRQQIQKLETNMLAQQSSAQNEALREEIRRMQLQISAPREPAKPAFGMEQIVALMGALVPVFTTMITANKDRQQLALDAQRHASDQQFNMLTALMTKKGDTDPGLKMLMDLLPKLLDSRDPAKHASVMESLVDSQLQTLHMTGQMMQSLMPEADSPGMQMVKELINGVMGVVEHTQTAREQAAQQQTRALPAQQRPAAPQPAPQPAAVAEVVSQPPPANAVQSNAGRRVAGRAPTPRELALAIVRDVNWPADMKSPAWTRLLTTLHELQRPAEVIGEEVAQMIQGLFDSKSCPEYLLPMFEDGGPQPSELLRPLFGQLPIGQQMAPRLEQVLTTIDGMYQSEGDDDDDDDDDNDDALRAVDDAETTDADANGVADNSEADTDEDDARIEEPAVN